MTRRNLEASGVAEPESKATQLAMAAGEPEVIAVAAFLMLPSCYRCEDSVNWTGKRHRRKLPSLIACIRDITVFSRSSGDFTEFKRPVRGLVRAVAFRGVDRETG
jgi:hypothetical protein